MSVDPARPKAENIDLGLGSQLEEWSPRRMDKAASMDYVWYIVNFPQAVNERMFDKEGCGEGELICTEDSEGRRGIALLEYGEQPGVEALTALEILAFFVPGRET